MRIAFLFPGQGAQTPGFLDRLPDEPAVKAALAEAGAILGRDIRELQSEKALASTVAVQLTTVVAGVATHLALLERGVRANAVAGLSVGAFTAAVACGALRFADALMLVRLRGELMERACPQGLGMAAICGLGERQISALIERVNENVEQVYLANLNSPTQFVLAGTHTGLDAVVEQAALAGARKAERLAVAVPSHCRLFASVAEELAREIAGVTVANPPVPYISNCRARATRDGEEIRADLARNVMYPVRWYDGTTALFELGTRLFVEMPPGRVLTDLAEVAFPEARAVAAEDTSWDTIAVRAQRERSLDARV